MSRKPIVSREDVDRFVGDIEDDDDRFVAFLTKLMAVPHEGGRPVRDVKDAP